MNMSQRKVDYLSDLFELLSQKLNRPFSEMKQFYDILKQNWYDNEQSLRQITDQQYIAMKIPVRLSAAIKQQLKMNKSQKKKQQKYEPLQRSMQIEQQQHISLDEFTMSQHLHHLQKELKNQQQNQPQTILQILQTLSKLIHNIVQSPQQIKYRSLKKSNQMVQRIILANKDVINFLQLFGFQQDSQKFILRKVILHQLIFIDQLILQRCQHLRKGLYQPFLGDVKMPIKSNNQQIIIQKSTNHQSFDQQFNKEALADVKYVDALDKLMEFRKTLMEKAPEDRCLKIYHKRHQKKNIQLPQIIMQQQFSKSDDKIITSYWSQILKQNQKSSSFQSKRKQQFQFLIKQKIHKQTLIKIRLPNQFVIQAHFGPLQKLSDVMKLVSDVVVGDLYLFHAPPVKRYDKMMHKTLFQLESVPSGYFYLGINGDYYIQNKYSQIVIK